jgi:hypothetical protein
MKYTILIGICMFVLGVLGTIAYQDVTVERTTDGYWIKYADESKVGEITEKSDPKGDWVCVNIKGMDYERASKVCNHEVGHEIFAEHCENNITKCMEVVEDDK